MKWWDVVQQRKAPLFVGVPMAEDKLSSGPEQEEKFDNQPVLGSMDA